MVMREKTPQKASDELCRKVFNTDDPFDRLILTLARTGSLDVTIVSINPQRTRDSTTTYTRKPLFRHGKPSS